MIPLDKNESYWLLDEELVEAASVRDRKALSRYPDYTAFKERLAAYAGTTTDRLSVTAGSDAVIEAIAEAFVGKGHPALLPVPTFYGYERILERAGVDMHPLFYRETEGSFAFPYAETLAAIEEGGAKALFLCHPNNPLGCPVPDDMLSGILDAAHEKGMVVVSDEAYFEFSGRTLLSLLDRYPKLIIVRTLSKGFGLSGARVGYSIAAPEIRAAIDAQLLPWPVAHVSVRAAENLLALEPQVRARKDIVVAARDSFLASLSDIAGCTAYPSETNFILVRVADAPRAAASLRDGGVAVATGEWMSRFPEARGILANVLRIAVPAPEDTAQVLDILRNL